MKIDKSKLEYRMYHLVPYNISKIQMAIQSYHAGIEYSLKYGNTIEYKKWAKLDKTVIILNGGTTNNDTKKLGTLQKHLDTLTSNKIKVSWFKEPDLNDAVTAIAFLVDERVWNLTKYPNPNLLVPIGLDIESNYISSKLDENILKAKLKKLYDAEVSFLRLFLRNFKLA